MADEEAYHGNEVTVFFNGSKCMPAMRLFMVVEAVSFVVAALAHVSSGILLFSFTTRY